MVSWIDYWIGSYNNLCDYSHLHRLLRTSLNELSQWCCCVQVSTDELSVSSSVDFSFVFERLDVLQKQDVTHCHCLLVSVKILVLL